ncbi:MAG: TonB-dependent receptor, partial [Gammaproteobacteria bacterium]
MFRYLRALVVLTTATAAHAHTPAPVTVTQLGSITITAPSGTPQPLDDTLAPVVVITPKTLKSFLDTDIASLLRFYAGLDIASNGGPGQPSSLFLRGTGSAQTLVMVDGIRVDDGVNGGAPLTNIGTSGVEKVEVVESPRSALYGSDAIGGVVSITLKQPPRKGFAAGANINGGHYSSRGIGAHAGGGNGTFFGGADFNWFETAGFPTKTASNQASAYRNQSLHAIFGAQNGSGEAYATFWRSTGTTDYLNFALDPVGDDYTDRVASVHLASQLDHDWHSRVILGQFFDGIDQVPGPNNPPGFTHTWRNSLDWRNDVNVGAHQLVSAGVFLAHQHVNANSFGTKYDEITRTRALYAQDQIHFGAHRIVLA